ncbi:MAG: hydrogenase formation protein HypD [Gammaproteobacteria bacterium]|uniref:hydrogenase formation protein HypD n=1 Tax=Hydrogenophaga sp. TaxID=1904254 RepID=UPI0025C3110C|nr:hydrogenase formation protein HypD [Hydrogenophaga sp.]MBU4181236.1 hydrogenase formation protein HypD [Gammaproteobacteria bacterium]MBU4281402.1 hydrogenase formation protein HypD [Gammaproteobacteria bacterium]MBU4325741.1 hydrogenase formation protein HypD [Gammaproteobacteria bacterium]MCG2654867.1 hydrogenase formation protein HypD [Hydrogenophaga sp.]
MKYIDEFRDGDLARQIGARIAAEAHPDRSYSFMEFCGGHTHAISRYGVLELLPPNVRMIHGPGCPVCVLPIGRIDLAIRLALERGAIVCTYGDTMRVPASDSLSLIKAKARGGDIRMVYSAADAMAIARANPQREVVFFAIGFETTTPPTALAIRDAAREGLANFSVLCCHVLTPSAITHILESPEVRQLGTVPIDGFIGPAHVSIVIGSAPYDHFAEEYRKPVVIAGFEPLDVMQAILMLVRQVNEGRAHVENEFTRAVTPEGNLKAQALVSEVFELRPSFEWRGLGEVPYSALKIREAFAAFDAERRFDLNYTPVADNKACECGAILRGVKKPTDCKIFGTVCTPENPVGSCMVSSEGACAAHYTYGRFRDIPIVATTATVIEEAAP